MERKHRHASAPRLRVVINHPTPSTILVLEVCRCGATRRALVNNVGQRGANTRTSTIIHAGPWKEPTGEGWGTL